MVRMMYQGMVYAMQSQQMSMPQAYSSPRELSDTVYACELCRYKKGDPIPKIFMFSELEKSVSVSSYASSAYSVSSSVVCRDKSPYAPMGDIYARSSAHAEYRVTSSARYLFRPDAFLSPSRPKTQFVNCADDIRQHIEEAFTAVTGNSLPTDISISICSRDELKRIFTGCGSEWQEGIMGFAINRKASGHPSEIFVRENELDHLMLTIGHEIGHIMSIPLKDARDEEAKAFAFSMVWMEKIKENDIAGLGMSFCMDSPANNGLHDVAFSFVRQLMQAGKSALDVFSGLILGMFTIEHAKMEYCMRNCSLI